MKAMKYQINNKILYTFVSAVIILSGTFLAIKYATGSRITSDGIIANTGMLSANSFPPGAQVFVDDKLMTATDETVNLEPGTYSIRISKAGYSPWSKRIVIEEQHVVQTNAQLFPSAPNLTALTLVGAENLSTSPDGQKIIYYTASSSAKEKNGLHLLNLSGNLNPLQRESKQLSTDSKVIDLSKADFIWSPDSNEVMVVNDNIEVMLTVDKKHNFDSLKSIRYEKKETLRSWEEEMYLRERQYLAKFPEEIIKIATTSAKNVYISPDKKRLLYTASHSTALPNNIITPPPASSTEPESRQLEPEKIYVYDSEEDKNFLIGENGEMNNQYSKTLLALDLSQIKPIQLEASPSAFQKLQGDTIVDTAMMFNTYHNSLRLNNYQWFPDSKHILYIENNKVMIMEYDGTNRTNIYSGPFANSFVYPWPDGSKLVILTSFSPDSAYNLYSIELKR